jgi:hypothetical protein
MLRRKTEQKSETDYIRILRFNYYKWDGQKNPFWQYHILVTN